LKSYTNVRIVSEVGTKVIYLQNICQLPYDFPLVIFDLKFSHFHITVGAKFVVGVTVDVREVEHFKRVVPTCRHILGHHPFGQKFLLLGLTESGHSIEDCEPFGENNGCRILDGVRGPL